MRKKELYCRIADLSLKPFYLAITVFLWSKRNRNSKKAIKKMELSMRALTHMHMLIVKSQPFVWLICVGFITVAKQSNDKNGKWEDDWSHKTNTQMAECHLHFGEPVYQFHSAVFDYDSLHRIRVMMSMLFICNKHLPRTIAMIPFHSIPLAFENHRNYSIKLHQIH